MGMVIADRVKDTSTTTGTGTLTLSGTAPSGFQAFATAMATGDICFYAIVGGAEWEIGVGTLVTATTLSRDQILRSSNANAVVNLSAGTKSVFITSPADEVIYPGTTIAYAYGRAMN